MTKEETNAEDGDPQRKVVLVKGARPPKGTSPPKGINPPKGYKPPKGQTPPTRGQLQKQKTSSQIQTLFALQSIGVKHIPCSGKQKCLQ